MQHVVDTVPFEGYSLIEDQDKISESFKDEVNKSKGAILAIVKGRHFVPGGVSRNHRLYPEDVWASVEKDENFMARVKRNGVIGRVGHEAEITDEDLAEGKFSHFTRNFNWKTGEAESVILDTPMGRNLLTLLRAGVVMYVSSRATGDYNGKDDSGNDIMDKNTFELERFDFVQDPGFVEAHPTMVSESFKKNSPSSTISSLLRIAKAIKAPLFLDGRDYLVESLEDSSISLSNVDNHICESHTLDDFEDVIPAIEESIIKAAHNEALENDLRIARFANAHGFDESYVKDRIDAGATFESIEAEHTNVPPTFAIMENRQYTSKSTGKTFLDRLFPG